MFHFEAPGGKWDISISSRAEVGNQRCYIIVASAWTPEYNGAWIECREERIDALDCTDSHFGSPVGAGGYDFQNGDGSERPLFPHSLCHLHRRGHAGISPVFPALFGKRFIPDTASEGLSGIPADHTGLCRIAPVQFLQLPPYGSVCFRAALQHLRGDGHPDASGLLCGQRPGPGYRGTADAPEYHCQPAGLRRRRRDRFGSVRRREGTADQKGKPDPEGQVLWRRCDSFPVAVRFFRCAGVRGRQPDGGRGSRRGHRQHRLYAAVGADLPSGMHPAVGLSVRKGKETLSAVFPARHAETCLRLY